MQPCVLTLCKEHSITKKVNFYEETLCPTARLVIYMPGR
jgi:hypothetical protein